MVSSSSAWVEPLLQPAPPKPSATIAMGARANSLDIFMISLSCVLSVNGQSVFWTLPWKPAPLDCDKKQSKARNKQEDHRPTGTSLALWLRIQASSCVVKLHSGHSINVFNAAYCATFPKQVPGFKASSTRSNDSPTGRASAGA